MWIKKAGLLPFLILLVATASTAWAGSTLHIGFGAETECAIGCGGHPNTGFSNIVDIFQTSSGATTINPVLLILGIPDEENATLFDDSSISGLTSYNPYPEKFMSDDGVPGTEATFGTDDIALDDSSFGTGEGFRGKFKADTGGDVYSFLGLGGTSLNNQQLQTPGQTGTTSFWTLPELMPVSLESTYSSSRQI